MSADPTVISMDEILCDDETRTGYAVIWTRVPRRDALDYTVERIVKRTESGEPLYMISRYDDGSELTTQDWDADSVLAGHISLDGTGYVLIDGAVGTQENRRVFDPTWRELAAILIFIERRAATLFERWKDQPAAQ